MNNEEFLLKHIENLEEENKRLRNKNKNTIKIKVNYNNFIYEIDTQIKKELIEFKTYYLPTDNINPQKCQFIYYHLEKSLGSVDFTILATIDVGDFNGNPKSVKLTEVSPYLLFKNKSKAGEYYLEHKKELNFDFLKNL